MKLKINLPLFLILLLFFCGDCFASSIKEPEFGGEFYPAGKAELSGMIDDLLQKAAPESVPGEIFALISPHAGYGYSGETAAFGYKLIKNKPYKTVIILGAGHHKLFNGAALYAKGAFLTSLGKLNVDEEFAKEMLGKDPDIFTDESAFTGEHSVEVQLPFLQKVLSDFKIVPVIVGDCTLDTCKRIALLLKNAIGKRKDVLVVASTDLYHGYDPEEAAKTDAITLDFIQKMDYEGLHYALRDEKAQACGGFAAVVALILSKEMGCSEVKVLNHTNSAIVTAKNIKGEWTVGYASVAVLNPKGEGMLNDQQRKRLLKIARDSIETYLKTGKKLEVNEADPVLSQEMGAFVTLNKDGQLRGCIGSLTAAQALYLTVRDMAVEAAVDDPRFSPLKLEELKGIDIEISALSPLQRVDSADKITLGKHGVVVRKGYHSGVFLPQVATETGWSKEEFLSNLCAQKAGLAPSAWKDKETELYIFSAEVFSDKEPDK
ncbi:AmmeMemoRadiSam system protein B [bacterium]|nr:MAG: AmmeMemoRadiSam system protein B [bacterium]